MERQNKVHAPASHAAAESVDRAHRQLQDALKIDFPKRTRVAWDHGAQKRRGFVSGHGGEFTAHAGYVFIENPASGAVHSVHFSFLRKD
jgi:hypothetical protein